MSGFMQTYTGKKFYPFNPTPESVDILDIAHALAMNCRFGGHCLWHYSVAQHSVLIAEAAEPEDKLRALLHDAPEAYIGDMIRPVKHHKAMAPFRIIDGALDVFLNDHFGLEGCMLLNDAVKLLDNRILTDEREQVMSPTPFDDGWPNLPALGVTIERWSPETARWKFLNAFEEYSR